MNDNSNQNMNNGVNNNPTINTVNNQVVNSPINNQNMGNVTSQPINNMSQQGYVNSQPVQQPVVQPVEQPQVVNQPTVQPVVQPQVINQPINNQPMTQPVVNSFNNPQQGYVNPQVYPQQNFNNQPQQPYGGFNNANYQQQSKNSNNKKYIILGLLALVAIILIIIVFASKKSSGGHSNAQYDRTIMVYMVGSNLEEKIALGTYDLKGIDYNQLNDQNTKLIVIAGGAAEWHNNYIDVNSTSIYELTANGYVTVKKQNRINMGDASTLRDFLNYSYDAYPAKKYDLIFWDHGMGVLGGEHDSLSDDYLLLQETKSALNGTKFKGNNKLELVLFRTCLNGTLEVADTLKDHAHYMVASQEVTRGYINNSFLKVLNDIKNTDDAKEFGKKYVDGYMTYINDMRTIINENPSLIYSTYSVIDLSKIDEVEENLNAFFKDINSTSNYSQVAKSRATMLQYGNEEPSYDSIDLYTFVEKIQTLSSNKATKLLRSLNEAIVYYKSSDSRSKGLSIYFPYNGTKELREAIITKVYNFSGLTGYKEFINSFNRMRSSNAAPLSFAPNDVDVNYDSNNGGADFQLKLTDGQAKTFAKAEYLVFKKQSETSYLPVYSSGDVEFKDNTLSASIKDRQLKVINKSNKSEQVLSLIESMNTDEYILYYCDGTLSNFASNYTGDDLKIMKARLLLKLDKKTNNVTIENVFVQNSNSEVTSKKEGIIVKDTYNVVAKLDDYKYIVFNSTSKNILNKDGSYSSEWKDDTTKTFELETKDLSFGLEDYSKNKNYYAVFKISDIYGNDSYSKLIELK